MQPGPSARTDYPPSFYLLFLFFAVYLTLPVVDIPLLGLSLSAPVFFLVALPVLLRPPRPWFASYRRWIGAAILIWLGLFTSVVLNGFTSSGTRVDSEGLLSLVRFAYWLLVFVVTTYMTSSQRGFIERMVGVIAAGIVALAFLRLGEAVLGGAIGAWTDLQLMSQNNYGIQFSTFYPFVLPFVYWGYRRKLAILAVLILFIATMINGSRAGWLAVLAGTLVFHWMFLRTHRRIIRSMIILLLLAGMMVVAARFAPSEVVSSFEARVETFRNLDVDKSYAIRRLLVQKGMRLFQENPWFGVGVSRWRKESIPLEIPQVLRYESQEHFDAKSSHNSYISFLAEGGLVGTVPLFLLILFLAIRGYRSASRLAARGQLWALGVYAGFVGISVHLWALSGLTGTVPWFVYGLVAGLIVLERKITIQSTSILHASRFSLPRARYR